MNSFSSPALASRQPPTDPVAHTISGPRSTEYNRPTRVEHAAYSMCNGYFHAGHLCRRDTPDLPDRLLQCIHSIHTRVHVTQSAAIGIDRESPARGSVPLSDEACRLSRLAKTEVFQSVEGKVRKGVVEHQMIHVGVTDARLCERITACTPERSRSREVLHLADHRCLAALPGASNVDRALMQVRSPVGARQYNSSAAVADDTAHQQTEGVGDHPGRKNVFNRNRIFLARARIERGPLSLCHCIRLRRCSV